jgi:hypothetical protein
MPLTTQGDSQETLSFPPSTPQEHVQRFRVTLEAAESHVGSESPVSRRRRARALAGKARRHWLLLIPLTAGLGLRVVTQLAYRPALLYIDSAKYLTTGLEKYDPQGYRDLVLKPLAGAGNLAVVAGFQHLLGLAMALVLYTILIRRRVPRWAATLAATPLLLDAYQLQMEQTIMPDVTFEALIVAGLAILLWNPRPTVNALAAGGFVLGLSATVRQVGEVLLVPALAVCLLSTRGWRARLSGGSLLTISFAIPVLVYMTYSAVVLHDRFELSDRGDAVLYGRVAAAADCPALRIPAAMRGLCPSPQVARSFGVDELVNNPTSPAYTAPLPAGLSHAVAARRFSYAVLEQQPLHVAGAIAGDAVKLFALTRNTDPGDTPVWRWQFQLTYPAYPPTITVPSASALFRGAGGGGAPVAVRPLAVFLRDYQLHGGYTPGPFLLLALLAGIGGMAAGWVRRDTRAALACLLVTGAGAAALLGADMYEFSWRYQLPALVTLPAGGVLGAAVILTSIRDKRRTAAATGAPDPAVTLGRCLASGSRPTSGPSSPASSTRTPGSG